MSEVRYITSYPVLVVTYKKKEYELVMSDDFKYVYEIEPMPSDEIASKLAEIVRDSVWNDKVIGL